MAQNVPEFPRIDRRTAVKWMLAAYAGAALAPRLSLGATPGAGAAAAARGYGTDPDLLKTYKPGDLWPLTLTEPQRRTAIALCDVIIPADEHSPAASTVGVHDFIDEWISAPYPEQQEDRPVIVDGLAWIDAEAQKRFGLAFAAAVPAQQTAICDDVCDEAAAKPEFKAGARFFARFRDLTSGGFYTTPEGMKDLRYIGNVPLPAFDGPPPELIKQLGLDE
ncbi:MAG TPA: gluconate 2-dehydrogenase subunit 3 family protein [Opitutus sp.]|nr:gluconate 2-dehydrogenase subunit 3 family protein [Opitutus sp.]